MIYITGDTHGIRDAKRFKDKYFQEVVNKQGNTLIILGDAGFTWPHSTNEILEFYKGLNLKCKVVSILGNNDNYDDIYSRAQHDFCGGKAICIDGKTPNDSKIMYLMNGYIYDFEGKKFAVLGGADSYNAPFRCGYYSFDNSRVEHESWWKEELPSAEDYYRLKEKLLENNKVDFMLSHDATTQTVFEKFGWSRDDNNIPNKFNGKRDKETRTVRDMNNEIESLIDCQMWFFGHHHYNITNFKKFPMVCMFNYFADVNEPKNVKIYNPKGEDCTSIISKTNVETYNF